VGCNRFSSNRRRSTWLLVQACAFAVAIGLAPTALAQTYYVATDGSDDTGDGTSANEWATITHALDTVPDGATVIFSAHGVSPDVRARAAGRGLKVIDATCPLVTKVHHEAVRFAREGRPIVLVGHQGHDEVVGTMGHAPEHIQLIGSAEEAEALRVPDADRVAVITQTTLSLDDTSTVVDVLRRRFPSIEAPARDDICYATQNRQVAVKALARRAPVILVIGSKNSSNSNRLAEVAQAAGKRQSRNHSQRRIPLSASFSLYFGALDGF